MATSNSILTFDNCSRLMRITGVWPADRRECVRLLHLKHVLRQAEQQPGASNANDAHWDAPVERS